MNYELESNKIRIFFAIYVYIIIMPLAHQQYHIGSFKIWGERTYNFVRL